MATLLRQRDKVRRARPEGDVPRGRGQAVGRRLSGPEPAARGQTVAGARACGCRSQGGERGV